jgi:hypothetical protein
MMLFDSGMRTRRHEGFRCYAETAPRRLRWQPMLGMVKITTLERSHPERSVGGMRAKRSRLDPWPPQASRLPHANITVSRKARLSRLRTKQRSAPDDGMETAHDYAADYTSDRGRRDLLSRSARLARRTDHGVGLQHARVRPLLKLRYARAVVRRSTPCYSKRRTIASR